jgi:hypothetical protein
VGDEHRGRYAEPRQAPCLMHGGDHCRAEHHASTLSQRCVAMEAQSAGQNLQPPAAQIGCCRRPGQGLSAKPQALRGAEPKSALWCRCRRGGDRMKLQRPGIEPPDRLDHRGCVATSKAFEQQYPLPNPDRQARRAIVMGGAAAHTMVVTPDAPRRLTNPAPVA